MAQSLKPLNQQVIVITGASSGIGLATAVAAAKQGAKLVLAARSERTLQDLVQRMTMEGAEAISVTADVGDRRQIDRQQYDELPRDPDGTLYKPGESGRIHGEGPASQMAEEALAERS